MKVLTCNKCRKPIKYKNYFVFNIEGFTSSGQFLHDVAEFDGPEVRLDDFCLCEHCMKKFS